MKNYKAFIFDFDLTLADSTKGIFICYKKCLEHYGYRVPENDEIFATIGHTIQDSLGLLIGEKPENVAEMHRYYVSLADEYMVKNTEFYPNVIAVLQVLKQAGKKVGIVSTKFRYRIMQSFEKEGSFPVDEIVGGEDVKAHKPDPEGLLLMIDRLGVSKDETLYFGDSYIDAETAQKAGVDFAGVLTGSTTKDVFYNYPYVTIEESILDIIKRLNNN